MDGKITLDFNDASICYEALLKAISWYDQHIETEPDKMVIKAYKQQRERLKETKNKVKKLITS